MTEKSLEYFKELLNKRHGKYSFYYKYLKKERDS